MKVHVNIWDKLTRLVVFLLFIAGLLMVAVWYLPLIKKNEKMRAKVLQLDMKIQNEEDTAKQLKNALEALRNPKAMERLTRESLGYAKPGEIVVRFEAPTTNGLGRP